MTTHNAQLFVGRRRVTDIPIGSVVNALENDGRPIRVVDRVDDPENSYPYFVVEPTVHGDDWFMWSLPQANKGEFFNLHICPIGVVLGEPRYMTVTNDAMQMRRPSTQPPANATRPCVRATLTQDIFRVLDLPSGEYAVTEKNSMTSITVRVHGTPVYDDAFSSDPYFFVELPLDASSPLPPLVSDVHVYELVLASETRKL